MAKASLSGQFAVILHADVAGSTRLVQQDEHLAHERMQDAFEALGRQVEKYRGRVKELRGDALLAQFERPSDAVSAALAFQAGQAEALEKYDDDIRPAIRIGIAMGEIVIADTTLTGAGVVMAQRVEQLAEPGGLCITGAIHEALPQRLPFARHSLGEQQLKGFDEAVRVYRVELQAGGAVPAPQTVTPESPRRRGGRLLVLLAVAAVLVGASLYWFLSRQAQPEPGQASPLTAADKPGVAVLPFTNLSADADQDYFSDGLTEDIITDLSRISGLRVIARHSSFAYRGQSIDVQQIGRDLGVNYILEGSVRRNDDRVRINAKLIDAVRGTSVWANRYDRRMRDVFELQDEVRQTIVSALAISLTSEEEQLLASSRSVNPDAYDLLLHGLAPLHRFTREDNLLARDYFEQAISIDPDYARAHANLALTYAREVVFAWTQDTGEASATALKIADRAEQLDATITQTHFARSVVYLALKKYSLSIASSRKSIELDPSYADGYGMLAQALVRAGDHREALDAIEMSKLLNPHYPFVYLEIEGHAYFMLGEYQKAVPLFREALERNSAFVAARLLLISSYGQLGRLDDAAWELQELLVARPDYSLALAREEAIYRRSEDAGRFLEGLQKAGLE